MKIFRIKTILFLLFTFMVYAASSVFGKLASIHERFSLLYFFFFACVVASMGIYAIFWQKILSFMPLNKAFLCKSVTILMILTISTWMFEEPITLNNIIGAGFIMAGLGVLAWKE